ncbi:MAG TPA: condensation domain-containing protein [Terriglobales bacterium]
MNSLKERIGAMSLDKRALVEARLLQASRLQWRPTHIARRKTSGSPFLSFGQQQMWFLDQLTPGTSTYNIPDVVEIQGALNTAALEYAFTSILNRHEVLRTRVRSVNGSPLSVTGEQNFKLAIVDLRQMGESSREDEARRLIREQARIPFDIAQDLMLRAVVVRLDDCRHWLLTLTHHMAWDVPSKAVLYRELSRYYESFITSSHLHLPELPVQYSDFAAWQREGLQGEVFERQAAYWREQLGNAAHLLNLPTDRPRPAVPSVQGAKHFFSFPASMTEKAASLSREQNATLFMTLLAGFASFLYGLTGQSDISIGSPIAGRNYPELQDLIGFFINTTVLRFDLRQNPTFRQLVTQARQVTLGAHAHQDLPFDKLVEIIRPRRDPNQMALVQVNFRVQSSAPPRLDITGLSIKPLFEFIDTGTSKFDLALELALDGSRESFWEYKADLFEPKTMVRFAGEFERMLSEALAQPDSPIRDLPSLVQLGRSTRMSDKIEVDTPKTKSLKNFKRKAVTLSPPEMVHAATFGTKLPLMLTPTAGNFDLADWATTNRDFINSKLLEHGAILFRGFNIDSPADFERVAAGICTELYGEYGDLPRASVAGKIYQSTPYPADKMILFHNESSHMSCWPQKINFYCAQPAEQGGATPVADCREVARRMDPEILRKFEEKSLLYVRNFSPGLDVSWQEFFHTNNRHEVESACQEAGMTCEWTAGDGLRVAQRCQAVTRHPKTGEKVFFNQVQLHHVYCLDPDVRESLLTLFKRQELPRHVYYGDGSEIEDVVMEHVGQVYEQCAVRFQWQKGDMITVDNMLVCHARDPHVGARKICVAMGEMITAAEVATLASAAGSH